MDSITHALYRAIVTEDTQQRGREARDRGQETLDSGHFNGRGAVAGLQPISAHPDIHEAYAGAEGSDLLISLTRSPELLALQMEFIAAGYCPPAGMYVNGADVIIAPGEVQLFVGTDKGDATWMASLVLITRPAPGAEGRGPQRRAGWSEQVG